MRRAERRVLLDEIIDAAGTEGGSSAAGLMQREHVSAAVLFHVAGLLDCVPDSIGSDRTRFGNLSIALVPTPAGILRYDDLNIAFDLDGATIAGNDGPTTMSGLLAILRYARDRADTLLYLPGAMRDDRIDELAVRTGAGRRFVLALLVHYRRVAERFGT
jgi:hypothetical protein